MTNHRLSQRIPGMLNGGDERPVDLQPADLIRRVIDGLKNLPTGALGVVRLDRDDAWTEEMLRGAADKYGVTLVEVIGYTIGGSMSWSDILEAVAQAGAAAVVTPALPHVDRHITRVCALITAADHHIWPRGYRWPADIADHPRDPL
ncbi:hypothetical protein [Nocardia anaemiae]|uniref:hypothetical protein n=1 Tax=Nocardia anaemiae TaxID=263910 RepID=UPI000AF01067|nr:hypothetical protein [Nocardia anaemiae]